MLKLHIIVVSTRPGRVGPSIARWFEDIARRHGKFEIRMVDLAEIKLPFLDEPAHPRLQTYEHPHTKRWSEIVASGDAYVFVTPEYNFGVPAPLVNALDFVFKEWQYKPAAFVSYGGQSGGMRAVQMAKMLLAALKVVPIVESVTLSFFAQHRDAAGKFNGTEAHEKSAVALLDELLKWAEALAPMRKA